MKGGEFFKDILKVKNLKFWIFKGIRYKENKVFSMIFKFAEATKALILKLS